MMSMPTLRQRWPLITLLGSTALLAGAHAFQYFGGLQPCPLCLDQRNWHWGAAGLSAAAVVLLHFKPGLARWALLVIGLVLFGSFAQAAYHVAVEQHWVVAQCDTRINWDDIRPLDFDGPVSAPACDEIAWQMFGVSMAGYNALISVALAIATLAVAVWPERKA
ncbi:MAG: disulfide bond formation protein B [Hyphomonadaceae bacterium]|nr:disulfide bond formation protein B [Hyphomonadaceae bacterium]